MDLFSLMRYAKSKGLEVRLNTNGLLITREIASKLAGAADNILIPIESGNDESEGEITGGINVLSKKINAIKLLKQAGVSVVRIGTVGTRKGIEHYEKIERILLDLPINEWEWYRPISNSKIQDSITPHDLELLVNRIINTRKKTSIKISIANAVPFCAFGDEKKMASVCSGAKADDGHSRIVVDPRGFVKPHYFVDRNIGDPLDILGAWNNSELKKIRKLEHLSKKCQKCRFVLKCRGGSRHEAMFNKKTGIQADPLMCK